MLLLMRGITIVVGGSHHDNSAIRLCIQACCAVVNPDCSLVVTTLDEVEAPRERDIDIIEVDVAAELAIIEGAKGFHFLQIAMQ